MNPSTPPPPPAPPASWTARRARRVDRRLALYVHLRLSLYALAGVVVGLVIGVHL